MAAPSAALALVLAAGMASGQSTEPFPSVFELSSLLPGNGGDGSTGFVINGINRFDYSCGSVSSAGDVNGDGIDDIIIGAAFAEPFGTSDNRGESYVVFGGASVGSTGSINLSSLNGSNGFVLQGIDGGDYTGRSVSSAGDVNGDGIDDLVIGAPDGDPNGIGSGESYVVFGGAGVGSSGTIELASLDGTNGFVLNGEFSAADAGQSVSSAGDVNGDGIDDVIIGSPARYFSGIGRAYVVFGGVGVGSSGVIELSSLNGTNGFVLSGINSSDEGGDSVSSAGDVNGDGIDDLIIGAPGGDPNGTSSGESYVVFGDASLGSSGSINLSSLNGLNGFVLNGIDTDDRSGRSVSSAGDVNDDGFVDLIIGAGSSDPNGIANSGESYVVFGGVGIGSSGVVELSSLNGSNGFVLNGIDGSDFSGNSVSSAGDVNGDGVDDLIIGATGGDPNGASSGESYVVFGDASLGSSGSINLSSLNGLNGFVLNGINTSDGSGRSVSSAGDFNDDGIADLIIGATGGDPNGQSNAGESYVVFGRDLSSSACPADFDGDGSVNILDVLGFINIWNAQGPGSDFNADGTINILDVLAFLNTWNLGCP